MRDASSAARLVILATAAVFINYIDRGNLATAASLIQDQLHLSATQIGILLSAFYYGYVVCMPAMGWLAERYGAKRVMATGVFVWSIATFATGFAGSFAALLVLRVVLGIGESVAFPCASKVLAQAVEVGRLGIANGVLSFGYLLGPAVGTLLGGYLMLLYGWHAREPGNRHCRSARYCGGARSGEPRSATSPRTTVTTSSCHGCRSIW